METEIDVQNVTKTYGGRRAVDDVSLQVRKGEIFAILGPNGAGKTTLVEAIAGLRAIDSGQIRVLGLGTRVTRVPTENLDAGERCSLNRPARCCRKDGIELHQPTTHAACAGNPRQRTQEVASVAATHAQDSDGPHAARRKHFLDAR